MYTGYSFSVGGVHSFLPSAFGSVGLVDTTGCLLDLQIVDSGYCIDDHPTCCSVISFALGQFSLGTFGPLD